METYTLLSLHPKKYNFSFSFLLSSFWCSPKPGSAVLDSGLSHSCLLKLVLLLRWKRFSTMWLPAHDCFFFFFPSVPIPAATGNYSFSCPVVWLSNSDKIVLELPPSLFLNPFINEPKNQSKRRNPSFSMTIQCFSLKPRLASHLGLHSWSVEIVIVVFAPPMTLPEEAMLPAIVVTS